MWISALKCILRPRGQRSFLASIEKQDCKILDVGCGNESSIFLKKVKPCSKIFGIDVSDYNQTRESKRRYEKYVISEPQAFADSILSFRENFDIVISNHNIEHCNDPVATFKAMVERTEQGGHIFIATPSLKSVTLPSRGGNLNFYDDPTHSEKPVDLKVLFKMEADNLECLYYSEESRPFFYRLIGFLQEWISKKRNWILLGTWDYHGFEQIIWLRKAKS